MSLLTVRRNAGSMMPTPSQDWEPLRMMRDLLRWDPFREMTPFFSAEERPAFSPNFDVRESKDSFVFKADVPGLKEQDLEISLTGNRMTISGKREEEKEDKGDRYYVCERSYGAFTRTFTLPEGVDGEHIRAELQSGTLTLVLPKRPEVQPKKIAVRSADKSKS
jgi:HSP20 family protein